MNTLVKLEYYSENFLRIRTYDRIHGSKWGFLVDKNRLSEHINNGFRFPYVEYDGWNVICIKKLIGKFSIQIDWLEHSYDANNSIHGYRQCFSIPKALMLDLLSDAICSEKYLYKGDKKPTRIVNRANRTLRNIADNSLTRRAFSKAMRDCFNYDGDTVYLYDDGGYSFYFEDYTDNTRCMNGGLILREGSVYCKDGVHRSEYYYSVHT